MSLSATNRKLLLYPFLATALISVIFMVGLDYMLESWVYERNEQELHRITEVTEKSMNTVGATADEMDLIADSVGLATSNMRISIIDETGRIIGDSFYDETQYQNFASQLAHKEVSLAFKQGQAKAIRESQYLNEQTYFYARRFATSGMLGVIRVSMSMTELNQALVKLRWLLLLAYLGGVALLILLLASFANKLKDTINKERRLLERRVEERTSEIDMLQRLASMLAACKSLSEVQSVVSDIVPTIIGKLPCSVSLINEKSVMLEQKLKWGGDWPGLKVFGTDECWALRKGRYHLSKDKHSSLTCQHMGTITDKTLCVPLLAHGQAIGLLHVLLGGESEDLHLNLIFTIGEHLGLALANLNMQEKLRDQAIKDPLTKIYNRRFMDETLEKELNRCERHGKSLAMLLLDIDHFKPFNDNFGHDAGDFVLKRLAVILSEGVRKEDVPCRIGGEEFAILLPETKLEEAELCANKLLRLVRLEELFFNGVPLGSLTVSIGIACFPQHGKDALSLYKSADIALYEAKTGGRDQVKMASDINLNKVLDITSGKKTT